MPETIQLMEAYERESFQVRYAFDWLFYRGEPAGYAKPGREAWFRFGPSGTDRWCAHCGDHIEAEDSCWLGGGGFVLCANCPQYNINVRRIQGGIFRSSFTPEVEWPEPPSIGLV